MEKAINIMTDISKSFLNKHSHEIIQKTRNPLSLADTLHGEGYVSKEMHRNIRSQKQEMDQMREIFKHLNSEVHFICVYDWLKENEPHLIEELEKSDTEAAAPQRKRPRGQTYQNVDETDNNHTGVPDLKMISTFAKLESWVSKPQINQKLISDLEGKLGEKGMEALKKELNDKELKNNLGFNAKNIDDIKKNKELETFLVAKNKAKFPKLTFNMFFKKGSPASSGKKAESSTDYDKPIDTTADYLNSSGYGSSTTDQSLRNWTQNDDQMPDEVSAECSHIRDTDLNENKNNKDMQETHYIEVDGQSQPPDQSPNASPKWANEPIPKKETPLEDTGGSRDVQENEEENMQDSSEPSPSKLLQNNSTTFASDKITSRGLWDTQVKSEAEIKAQNIDTAMPAPEETQNTFQERDGRCLRFHTSTSGAVKDQTGEASCSNNEAALGTNKIVRRKKNNLKEKNYIKTVLHDWAEKQCNNSKEEINNVLNQISFINKAEHCDYPCFTAENVIEYKNPTTGESQIIFITEEKNSSTTKTMFHYVMYVCDIKKAMILSPNELEQEIIFDENCIHINKCIRFIFEAFAPALAVFKKIRKEDLCSPI